MKKYCPMLLCLMVVLALLVILILTRTSSYEVNAQGYPENCCTPPYLWGNAAYWPKHTRVVVTIDTQFTDIERQAIAKAFTDWNVQAGYCTDVLFGGFQVSDAPPPSGANVRTHWVRYGDFVNN